ncbi:arsenosugar biosynthesis radical SAM protein ArsS [Puniceicoccaceae bacterium K14]|nr:arsenosugar biosynthesis radical SAM protein ArsS [Puniceicoccaceae bacterium K14]
MQTFQSQAQVDFTETLSRHKIELSRETLDTLQINLGKLCNLTCSHCHVNAGPKRKEIMTESTVYKILDWFTKHPTKIVDLTGGAPEMNPHFRTLVDGLISLNSEVKIIDRCNLVILNEPGYEWVGEFLASRNLEVVASMPCYTEDNVNAQRGNGVFDRSISALQELNQLGFGLDDPRHPLHLVYNPGGAWLPPEQSKLEQDYKRELKKHFDISFDRLYALTNLPVSRFASYLRRNGEYDEYMELLVNAFNPSTVNGLMCRNTLSVDWTGQIYDCDFNQMLRLHIKDGTEKLSLWGITPEDLAERAIQTAQHCFGCTAGCGSSCGGTLA